jgi:hypothetical protein
MAEEWKPNAGEVVWVKSVIDRAAPDSDGDLLLRSFHGVGVSRMFYAKTDDLRPDTPAPLTDAEVLRRAAVLLRDNAYGDSAAKCREVADVLDPPRVDVLAVLREATEYVTENQPIYARLAAAIKQMEADNA